jgi:tetratricopeptide (TPR) repeat protein
MSQVDLGSSRIGEVAAWDQLIQRSPDRAVGRAVEQLELAVDDDDRAVLLYAAGRALLELGRIDEAGRMLSDAADLVVEFGVRGEARMSVLMTAAIVFAESGDLDRALASLQVLADECVGVELGRVLLQRSLVLLHVGRLTESLAALDRSDRMFAGAGADRDRFRMHLNRGVVLLQQGSLPAAEADFSAAAELARRLDMTAAEGQCFGNLGVLHGRARRLLDALDAFDRAATLLDAAGRPDRVTTGVEIDRAEVLMYAGMVDDAVSAAQRAASTAHESGNGILVGDAMVMCARTELHAGRLAQASRTARSARDHLVTVGRADMVTHAESILAIADLRRSDASTATSAFGAAADIAGRLYTLGWQQQGDELIVERLRAAWRLREWGRVSDDLESLRLHAWSERRDLALIGWFAEAIARHLEGDAAGSIAACTDGLDFLDQITAEATDLEARSAAQRLGHDLSRWIIEIAVGCGDADTVLSASEGTRARSLHEELDERDQYRPLTEDGARRLLGELRGRLAGRCLVQWVVADDRLHAVVCDERGNRLVDVADVRSVVRERDRTLVWLDRAAAEPDGSSERALRAARLLDELLLEPLDLPSDDALVVVPVDELHGIPWSGLRSVSHREVVLSPSSRLWLDADRRSSMTVRTAGFVSGPNLAADDVEWAAVGAAYPGLDHAGGAGATAATVRAMFGGHDLVHVAAHGCFRSDRPLLSTLELADGLVTLHDAIPAKVACKLAVLSSCEGGAHRGAEGSEVLGLAALLLARGAASVLAPLTVVRDLECGEFVAAVHQRFADGVPFGRAVADVRSAWLGDDDLSRWAVASSFMCFGSGATARRV